VPVLPTPKRNQVLVFFKVL